MIVIHSPDTSTVSHLWTGEKVSIKQFFEYVGIDTQAPCGGHGRCGKCRIYAHGEISSPTAQEFEKLTPDELAQGLRLSCLTILQGNNVEIEIPATEKIAAEARILPSDELWDPWASGLGLSVDIGTTTVVGYLWDLDKHQQLGVATRRNPQESFGSDVISRLEASLQGKSSALQKCIIQCLNELSEELCIQTQHCVEDIHAAVITGNTAMLYLLRGYNVHDLATAPFVAHHHFGKSVPAPELGLILGQDCQVYIPPCISAYVGADISCGLLACKITQLNAPALLADIGTNGEMALALSGKILCCSTAAGPAFEGVGISCGSGAVPGAIDRIWLSDNALSTHTIGNAPARTLCGSGLIDAIYCLIQIGAVEDTGFMEEESVTLQPHVTLSRQDVRALQLAKSAVCAGIQTLLSSAAVTPQQVETVYLSGGFGTQLSPESAIGIGLLPSTFAPIIKSMGNTSAAGAALLLRSKSSWQEIEAIVSSSQTVELAGNPLFQERFMENMILSEVVE